MLLLAKFSGSALLSNRDPIVYQVGKYSNLYVLNQQDYSCVEVYSLGHYKDSIVAPPIQWAGYILVAVNGGNSCDLHVFKPQKNGTDLVRIQLIQRALDSPMSLPFINAGSTQLMAGENGDINMLTIDPTSDFDPITADANKGIGDSSGPRPLVSAAGSNIWVAADGIVHARISRSQGKITRLTTKQTGDQFLLAAQKLDDYVMHVHRRKDSGMLTVALSNAKDLEAVWKTNFGGEVAGKLADTGGALTAVSNQGDIFRLDGDVISSGKAVPTAQSSKVIENLQFNDVVQYEDGLAVVGPIGQRAIVAAVAAPANKPACRPLKLDNDLIIASSTGYVARVNPKNNSRVGTPFQPAISPSSVINWLPPIEFGSDQISE